MNDFRQQPHNIEAEQALLGAILINNDAWHRVAEFLRAEHFYEPVHGRIFAAMERLIGAGRIADPLTLKAEFDADEALRELDGTQYLARLALAAEAILNAEDYGRLIHDLALRRGLVRFHEEGANAAYDASDGTPATSLLEAAQNGVDGLAQERPAETFQSLDAVVERIEQSLERPAEAFSTGLPTLDSFMAGGIRAGTVYGFESRPKQFKTGTLGTIAAALTRQRTPYLFLALEMGAARIVERQIAAEVKRNAVAFRKRDDTDRLVELCREFRQRHAGTPAYLEDEPGLSFDRLRRRVTAAVKQLGIRVLLVDYWQLVTGVQRGQNLAEFHASTAQWLASFAAKNNVAVLIASQENRSGESYGSDGLAKACDWLAVLHKVEVEEWHVGTVEGVWMDVKFNRDGPDGAIGSSERPAFRIDRHGPALKEFGDW